MREVSTGTTVPLEGVVTLGSKQGSTVRLTGANIAPQHAKVQRKGGRVYITALVGDGDFKADTFTWMQPDTQLRSGVDYMVSPGAEFSFGELGHALWRIEFEESSGSDAMADMLMKGLASSSSAEVRSVLDQRA